MRRLRRHVLITTAAVVAAVVVYLVLTLPPAAMQLAAAPPTTAFGAYHIHTTRSDGGGSVADVARAAADAGLQFAILTDHGDATRPPDSPQYLHGVLMIDAVEINTNSGHAVALGLNRASPFPLGAEARDTIEDIHRMGGWAVAAHPDSPHLRLQWRGDDVPVDAIEWLNADSEWRDEGAGRLLVTLGHYLIRPSESIASLFARPMSSLRRWDGLSKHRRVIGLAGVDAHASIGVDEDDGAAGSRTILARPTYRDMFRTAVQAVLLARPLTGDPVQDAASVLQALRSGRTYSVISALASPGQIHFEATDGTRTAGMGESLETTSPVTVSASVAAPANAVVVILRDGDDVASGIGSASFKTTGARAAYRAEVRLASSGVPWIVTNVIRTGAVPAAAPVVLGVPPVIRALQIAAIWIPESHIGSSSNVRVSGGEVAMAFQLAPGRPSGQFAAMSYPLPGGEHFESVTLTMRAERPMRVSVQLRQPGGADGIRWHRSVFVDETPRRVTLPLRDFDGPDGSTLTASLVRSLLVVVDERHTRPGTSGTVWVSDVSLGGEVPVNGLTSGR